MVKQSRTRRTIKNKKNNVDCLTVIGINCNGLSGKRDSLMAVICVLKPLAFLVQETKFVKKGFFEVKNFDIFESVRPSGGGSILTGVHTSLNPIIVSDGCNDDVEILDEES